MDEELPSAGSSNRTQQLNKNELKKQRLLNVTTQLYGCPKSRESIVRNANIPRMLRSGKLFDQRRCSSLNHLSALALAIDDGQNSCSSENQADFCIKEEDETTIDDTELVIPEKAESQSQVVLCEMAAQAEVIEQMDDKENAEADRKKKKATRVRSKRKPIVEKKLELEPIGSNKRESLEETAPHELVISEEASSQLVSCAMAAQAEVIEQMDDKENAEADRKKKKATRVRSKRKPIAEEKLEPEPIDSNKRESLEETAQGETKQASKKSQKRRKKKRLSRLSTPGIDQANAPGPTESSSPDLKPMASCLKRPEGEGQHPNKTANHVHWADENENAKLFDVKEFAEEKPRRRCTMFHKYT